MFRSCPSAFRVVVAWMAATSAAMTLGNSLLVNPNSEPWRRAARGAWERAWDHADRREQRRSHCFRATHREPDPSRLSPDDFETASSPAISPSIASAP
jgi:hypothetical protein